MPRIRPTVPAICQQCRGPFNACASERKRGKARFCSQACVIVARRAARAATGSQQPLGAAHA